MSTSGSRERDPWGVGHAGEARRRHPPPPFDRADRCNVAALSVARWLQGIAWVEEVERMFGHLVDLVIGAILVGVSGFLLLQQSAALLAAIEAWETQMRMLPDVIGVLP